MKGFLRKLKTEKKIQFIGNFFKDTKRAIQKTQLNINFQNIDYKTKIIGFKRLTQNLLPSFFFIYIYIHYVLGAEAAQEKGKPREMSQNLLVIDL